MQDAINQLYTNLTPQALGLADPLSITVLSLVAPGFLMFVIIFLGRGLMRPRWRGYWDAV